MERVVDSALVTTTSICPLLAMWRRALPVPTTSSEPGGDLHSADVQCALAYEVTERI